MRPYNLHTHTTFCDGDNTPAEMAAAAFVAGLGAIGFSGHSPLEGEEWCMAPADLPAYRAAVEAEREKYAGRMQVFLGLEQDFFSPPPEGAFDYLIGSVHGLRLDGRAFVEFGDLAVNEGDGRGPEPRSIRMRICEPDSSSLTDG